MKKVAAIVTVAVSLIISVSGQGFLNLNFESAYDLPGNPGEDGVLVSVTNALPNWTAGDGALSEVNYASNYVAGSEAPIGLVGGSLVPSGNYSAELYNSGSISQIGLVPDNAESLQFEANGLPLSSASGFSVSLGGQTLSYSLLSEGTNDYLFGANIPADLDGQSEALTFGCFGLGSGGVVLDNIQFSPASVPEPTECALIGLGVLFFSLRRRNFKIVPRSMVGISAP
jgi:hypothetical protein